MTDLELRGLDDLKRKLNRLPVHVRRQVAEPALLKAAQPVVREAKRRAPRRASGRGRESIEAGVRKDALERGRFTVAVGPSAGRRASRREGFYLLFVEKGTMPRVTDMGEWRGQIYPPAPFLRPALDMKRREVVEIARRELARGIESAAR